MRYICRCEAVQDIIDKAMVLNCQTVQYTSLTWLYAEKFVDDVLDYCHRDDFPAALTLTAAEFVAKWAPAQDDTESRSVGNAPLKSIKQNDTEFVFAVNSVSASGSTIEAAFETLKPKLNLYRKLVRPRCKCHTPGAGQSCGNTCTTTP